MTPVPGSSFFRDGGRSLVRFVFCKTEDILSEAARRLPWTEVAGLRVGDRDRLVAVLRGGGVVRLPVLRPRHLALVAAASGGRVPTPDGPTAPDDQDAPPPQ